MHIGSGSGSGTEIRQLKLDEYKFQPVLSCVSHTNKSVKVLPNVSATMQ